MKKKIKKCPVCKERDIKQSLYEEIMPDVIVIRRMKSKYGNENTIITGNDFKVICGNCGEIIYIVKK